LVLALQSFSSFFKLFSLLFKCNYDWICFLRNLSLLRKCFYLKFQEGQPLHSLKKSCLSILLILSTYYSVKHLSKILDPHHSNGNLKNQTFAISLLSCYQLIYLQIMQSHHLLRKPFTSLNTKFVEFNRQFLNIIWRF